MIKSMECNLVVRKKLEDGGSVAIGCGSISRLWEVLNDMQSDARCRYNLSDLDDLYVKADDGSVWITDDARGGDVFLGDVTQGE